MLSYLTLFAVIILSILLVSQGLIILGSVFVRNNRIEYYGRSLASFLALFLCASYGTLASAALNIAGYGGLGQWTTARAFKWTMWLFTGVWFEIEDPQGLRGSQTEPQSIVENDREEEGEAVRDGRSTAMDTVSKAKRCVSSH